jgi:CheY-like chemotaxis protein
MTPASRLQNERSPDDNPICPHCRRPIDPAQSAAMERGYAIHMPCKSRPTAAPPSSPRTILYIEDNAANLRLVELALARRPHARLLSADRGQLGLELARQRRPDLILLDIHLPDLEGTDLLPLIRQDPTLAQTPVIVISAENEPQLPARLLAAGAQAYLAKPLDLIEFFAAIDALLPPPT